MFKYFGFTGSSNLFETVGEKLDNGLFIFSTLLGTLFLTFGSAYAGGFDFKDEWENTSNRTSKAQLVVFNPITSLFLGTGLFMFGGLGTYFDQEKQKSISEKLQSENKRLKNLEISIDAMQEEAQEYQSRIDQLHKELVTTWLKGAYRNLNLGSDERVTIYYEFKEEFYLLARYSKNPKFNKIHRQKFPLNQGVIGQAWQHGIHIEENSPSSNQEKEWQQYMSKKYDYTIDKLESLTMPSCRYIALAIVDADDHIGVIAFESTNANFLNAKDNENTINDTIREYCKTYQSQLSKFVRDGANFDKEITIRRNNNSNFSVEIDIIKDFKGGAS